MQAVFVCLMIMHSSVGICHHKEGAWRNYIPFKKLNLGEIYVALP